MINIGQTTTIKTMLGRLICRLTDHVWDMEDLNEVTPDMEIGDEAVLRCRRCNTVVVSIEKTRDGITWNAHYSGAVLYEVNPEYTRKQGQKHDFNKFQEDNK